MKAIIYCSVPENFWTKKYFGRANQYMLPILGKRLIEFYIDFCVLSNVSDILILHPEYDSDFELFLGNGSKWGVNIKLSACGEDSIDSIAAKNSGFIGGEPTLILNGFFFPFYNKNYGNALSANDKISEHVIANKSKSKALKIADISEKDLEISQPHLHLINADSQKLATPCRPIEIDGIATYFNLNMDLLREHTDNLFMRGYSAESDAYLGMNDVIKTYAEIFPPVIIGDNVQIDSGSIVGEDAIVGDTSIIDMRSNIKKSIIFDHTYIGADLDFDSKIIAGSRIIDPINDIVLDTRDEHFSLALRRNVVKNFIKRICQIPLAILILLPLLLLRGGLFMFGTPAKRRLWIPTASGNAVRVSEYVRSSKSRDVWFFKLSLDRIPKLIAVIGGKMSLIGDTLRDARKDEELLNRYKFYSAGAFTYADSLGHLDPNETLIDDIYYRYNRTLRTDLQLLLCSFPVRLFHTDKNAEV